MTAALLMAAAAFGIIWFALPDTWTAPDLSLGGGMFTFTKMGIFWAVVIGLVAGVMIGLITEYYCSTHNKPSGCWKRTTI